MPRAPSAAAGEALPAAHLNLDYRRALARLRKEAEDEIERLIAFLDQIEPDPDLEDDELGEDDDPAEDDDNDTAVDDWGIDDDDWERDETCREPSPAYSIA